MKHFLVWAFLMVALSENSMCQTAKPQPFRAEITPVKSLEFEIDSIPVQIERAYEKFEQEKVSLDADAAALNLRSSLMLCMKGLFESQRNVVAFLQDQPEYGFSNELLTRYKTRSESQWYNETLEAGLSPDEVVDILRSEREVWMQNMQRTSMQGGASNIDEGALSVPDSGLQEARNDAAVTQVQVPPAKAEATKSERNEIESRTPPPSIPSIPVTIVVVVIAGIVLYLLLRRKST